MGFDKSRCTAWLLPLLFCLAASCAGLGDPIVKQKIDPRATVMLAEVLALPASTSRADRAAGLERVIEQYPEFVEAHRHLQNLHMIDNRFGYLVERYRKLHESHPENPFYTYLYGRLFTNPDRQRDLFQSATEKDPSFFWAYNGLGYAHINAGDLAQSEEVYKKAIQSGIPQVEPYRGLVSAYMAGGRDEEAEKLLAIAQERFPDAMPLHLLKCRLLAKMENTGAALKAMIEIPPELEPGADFFVLMLNFLDSGATDYDAKRVLFRFGPLALDPIHHGGPVDLVLGACCRKLGNLAGAEDHFIRVSEKYPDNIRARRELRCLYTVTFRMREAFAIEVMDFPDEWLEGSILEEAMPGMIELADRIGSAPDRSAVHDEGIELASRLVRCGWLDEAIHLLYMFKEGRTKFGNKALHLLDELYRHRHFEVSLREYFTKQYQDFRQTGTNSGWEEVLKQLSLMSKRILGEDIFENAPVMDYSPAGKLLDPRARNGTGPAAYFRKYNRFFLLGQKMGGPVEACLLDICNYMPDQKALIADSELNYDYILCENLRVPSLVEAEGGGIVGAALSSFIFINLDLIRQKVYSCARVHDAFETREAMLLDDPAPSARNDTELLDVRETWGVTRRLKYLSYKRNGSGANAAAYMAKRTQAVLCHELQHIADARRFLPIMHHLFWKLYRFAMLGFSPFKIEAWLEERAQMYALTCAEDPQAILSEITEYLGGAEFRSPYRRGYTFIMEKFVAYIHDHQERFPNLDFSKNLLHQVHKLSCEEIRTVGTALAEEEGLLSAID